MMTKTSTAALTLIENRLDSGARRLEGRPETVKNPTHPPPLPLLGSHFKAFMFTQVPIIQYLTKYPC